MTDDNFFAKLLCSIHTMLIVECLDTKLSSLDIEIINLFGWCKRTDHNIERLRLINKFLTICCLMDNRHLINLTKSLEN